MGCEFFLKKIKGFENIWVVTVVDEGSEIFQKLSKKYSEQVSGVKMSHPLRLIIKDL